MPYLNSLATQYAQATQYFGDTHPSIGNYFALTVGDTVTNDDRFGGIVSRDNIVRQLLAAGKTWRSYAENLPSAGYTGGDSGLYLRRHNPFSFFSDVVNSEAERRNLVPFAQFWSDLSGNSFPNLSFIIPNRCDDGHDCPLAVADVWLRINIAPLVDNGQFQSDGLLIITFDEDEKSSANGGGRVLWVAVGAAVRRGYQSTTFYQHESTLKLAARALGLSSAPNRAAGAPDMSEFFR